MGGISGNQLTCWSSGSLSLGPSTRSSMCNTPVPLEIPNKLHTLLYIFWSLISPLPPGISNPFSERGGGGGGGSIEFLRYCTIGYFSSTKREVIQAFFSYLYSLFHLRDHTCYSIITVTYDVNILKKPSTRS